MFAVTVVDASFCQFWFQEAKKQVFLVLVIFKDIMEVKKQLDMAKVRLKGYQVVEEIENEKDPVEDYL